MSLIAQTTKTIKIEVSNPSTIDRVDKPVVLKIDELGLGFVPKSAVVMSEDAEIPSQLDDLTGNRNADELAFVIAVLSRGKRDWKSTRLNSIHCSLSRMPSSA